MSIKAVLFDIGGTLIDYPSNESTKDTCETRWEEIGPSQRVLARMYEIYMERRRTGFHTLVETRFSEALASAIEEFNLVISTEEQKKVLRKLYKIHFSDNASLYKGTVGLLRWIKRRDCAIGLISNTPFPGSFLEEDLKRFRIFSYFDLKIWSSEFGRRKPHPSIFKTALRHLRIEPANAIYIGDTIDRDINGARRIGMPAIWINRGKERKDFSGYQVNKLQNVISVLESLF